MPACSAYVSDIVEAMSIKYNNRVYEMKQEGTDIIVLSLGEAFFDIPLYPFEDLPYPAINHYSHSRGIPALRKKLAQYYTLNYDVPVDPEEEIIITAGGKIAIHMSLMAILDPADEVIIHEPAWVSYTEQVKLCRGVPVMVPYYEPTTNIGRYVTNKTKAIVVTNPHNPRGSVMAKKEMAYLLGVARDHDLYLIADEVYSDFLSEEDRFISFGSLDPSKNHTIICNSMSKNYGISGWRIGYVVTNADLTFQILKINQHLITCPATVLEYYLVKHFDELIAVTKPQMRAMVEKRNKLAEHLDSLGMTCLPGTATFYFFLSIENSRLTSEQFCTRLLEEFHVSTVPGIGYGQSCDKFIRLSVGSESMERVVHGIEMVHQLICETSAQYPDTSIQAKLRPVLGNKR